MKSWPDISKTIVIWLTAIVFAALAVRLLTYGYDLPRGPRFAWGVTCASLAFATVVVIWPLWVRRKLVFLFAGLIVVGSLAGLGFLLLLVAVTVGL